MQNVVGFFFISFLSKWDFCGPFPVLIQIVDLGVNCVGTCCVFPWSHFPFIWWVC